MSIWFVLPGNPWFMQSARFFYGFNASEFAYGNIGGHIYSYVSFRVVLLSGDKNIFFNEIYFAS
jgi:hypothetical protein